MADYKVGNLQIVFDAVDETSKSFNALARNLKSVQKAIAKIGDTDLKPFVANIKQITKSFTPLLTNISGASEGIIALNQAIQKVGASKLSKVAEEVAKLQQLPSDVATEFDNLNGKIDEGNEKLKQTSTALVALSNAQSQANVEFENLNRIINYNSYDKVLASVGGLAKAWRNVYTTLSQLGSEADKVTGGLFSETAERRLQDITQKYFYQKEIVEQTNNAFRQLEEQYRRSKLSVQDLAIEDYNLLVAEKQKEIQFRQVQIATGEAGSKTAQYKKEIAKLQKELSKLKKPLDNSASGFEKIMNSIKRISIYRMIRRGIQLIVNSFKEGVGTLEEYDSGINQLMSQLTTSSTIIKTSMGSILLPILESIAPVLQEIAVGFANLGNVINASMAKMKGLTTYTKINTDKMLEYGKATKGTLLDFDKFRTLGITDETSILSTESIESLNKELWIQKENYQQIYNFIKSIGDLLSNSLSLVNKIATSSVVKTIIGTVSWIVSGLINITAWIIKIIDKSGLIEPILGGILAYLIYIGATKIITWLSTGALSKWIIKIITLLNTDLHKGLKTIGTDLVKVLTSTQALAISIGALAGSIIYLASNWSQLTDKQKLWIPLASTLIGLAVGVGTALVLSITAIKEALKLNPAAIAKAAITAALFTAAAGIAIGTAISTSKNAANSEVSKKANGGYVPVGTMFWAGEAGAETVTVGSSGRTEVTNVQQMEEALYNALLRYGRTNKNVDGSININIDGNRVFEATRKVANRRGLDFQRV